MPARTSQQVTRNQTELNALVVNQAGLADDPLAFVRVRWGPYDSGSGSRILTMQVVDRLDKPYAPRSFRGYKRRPGTADGRWLVQWYIANTEFGTPVSSGSTYTKGKQFSDVSGLILSETDENGTIKLTITKGGTQTWCHAGVIGLLRSRGIYWETAPDDDAPPVSTGGSSGGGGSGSGDIVTVAS